LKNFFVGVDVSSATLNITFIESLILAQDERWRRG